MHSNIHKTKLKRIWFCIDTPSIDLYYVAEPAYIYIHTGNRDHDSPLIHSTSSTLLHIYGKKNCTRNTQNENSTEHSSQ